MGVDISSLAKGRTISLSALSNKVVAIDAFNTLYQFLSIIRQPDGTPLRDRDGEVTSHLSGLFYRSINFLEAGLRPVFIFDGEPPALKRETIEQRIADRKKAEEAWQQALAEGDIRKAWSKATRASRLTKKMIEDSRHLLEMLGIPCIQAPSEGEAQASYMVIRGVAYASASQDFDSLLFGCPRLVRNLAISGKRRLPRTNRFVTIEPEEILLDEVLKTIGVTREQLVDIGILIGTDFNRGVRGMGPKKSLALIKKYGSIEAAVAAGKLEKIDSLDELRSIFLSPRTCDVSELKWGRIRRDEVMKFMCDVHSFSADRIEAALDRIPETMSAPISTSLDRWMTDG